jgi:hypothetical protein
MDDDLKTISKIHQSRQMFEELLVREKYDRRAGLLRGPGHNPNPPRPTVVSFSLKHETIE